jgi:putative FmdB family regulatory protein
MPIYEFRCKKCNDQIEVFQKLSDKPPTRCRKCGGRMEKQFSRTSVQFKGDGWYVTDYARKGGVAEKVEKELSSPEPGSTSPESSPSSEKTKSKKTPAKTTGSDKS